MNRRRCEFLCLLCRVDHLGPTPIRFRELPHHPLAHGGPMARRRL